MKLRIFTACAFAICACAFSSPHAVAEKGAHEAKVAAALKGERLGPLMLGLADVEVIKQLGKPEKQGKIFVQEADGMYVQEWSYPSKGLTLMMESQKRNSAKHIASITATAGNKFATAKGITIGSPESAVRKAYGAIEAKEGREPGRFVAGSIYGGIIFDFARGKVSSIFLGAAAE